MGVKAEPGLPAAMMSMTSLLLSRSEDHRQEESIYSGRFTSKIGKDFGGGDTQSAPRGHRSWLADEDRRPGRDLT
jgi:hypothetical protein